MSDVLADTGPTGVTVVRRGALERLIEGCGAEARGIHGVSARLRVRAAASADVELRVTMAWGRSAREDAAELRLLLRERIRRLAGVELGRIDIVVDGFVPATIPGRGVSLTAPTRTEERP